MQHYIENHIMNSNTGRNLTSKNYFNLMVRTRYGTQLIIGDILGQNFTSKQSKNLFFSLNTQEQTLENIERLNLSDSDRKDLITYIDSLIRQRTDSNTNNLANGEEQPNRARFCFDCFIILA